MEGKLHLKKKAGKRLRKYDLGILSYTTNLRSTNLSFFQSKAKADL